jgi:hypothetical protein
MFDEREAETPFIFNLSRRQCTYTQYETLRAVPTIFDYDPLLLILSTLVIINVFPSTCTIFPHHVSHCRFITRFLDRKGDDSCSHVCYESIRCPHGLG